MASNIPNIRRLLKFFFALPILIVLGFCEYVAWHRGAHQSRPEHNKPAQPFLGVSLDHLTATLFTAGNEMRAAGSEVFLEFRDARATLVDVGQVSLELVLKRPDTIMHSIGIVKRTDTPGEYRATLAPQWPGDWTANLSCKGTRGNLETNFTLQVH